MKIQISLLITLLITVATLSSCSNLANVRAMQNLHTARYFYETAKDIGSDIQQAKKNKKNQ